LRHKDVPDWDAFSVLSDKRSRQRPVPSITLWTREETLKELSRAEKRLQEIAPERQFEEGVVRTFGRFYDESRKAR
jgi:hypothetical protein